MARKVSDYLRNDYMPKSGFTRSGGFSQSESSLSPEVEVDGLFSPFADFDLPTGLTPKISDMGDAGPRSPLLFDVAMIETQHNELEVFHFGMSMAAAGPSCVDVDDVLAAEAEAEVAMALDDEPLAIATIQHPEFPTTKTRKKQVRVPEGKRDAKYHAHRTKNTAKAKSIRDRKREEKNHSKARLETALSRSTELRAEVAQLELMLAQAKALHGDFAF